MSTIVKRTSYVSISAALLIALLASSQSHAETKSRVTTTITVGEMCGGCVKQIIARFDKVKEVAKIHCDIQTKSVVLYPAKNIRLSPAKLWETMESIGKHPLKLVGPDGTFTSKPKKN
ncbi:hypothetical protein CA51_25060 [Rosistilla oblonga]|uniref:cation transporter n=1 Tax=Rosistilla oblonga TaxID=2527990 RepID=UPI00118BE7F3|nr:cation transporter [Rosistilla oblonga]QDV12620.1 hypothetical protein CA51_25060 [Rosistilla oblonga]